MRNGNYATKIFRMLLVVSISHPLSRIVVWEKLCEPKEGCVLGRVVDAWEMYVCGIYIVKEVVGDCVDVKEGKVWLA